MPIYEYECERCSLKFELKRRFSEDGSASCPQCQGEARRLFSPVPATIIGPQMKGKLRKMRLAKKSGGN